MEYYIAQIFGMCALVSCALSYQATKKKNFLIVQLITNIFYGAQYLILKAYSGFMSSFISLIKNTLFYNLEKRNIKISIWILFVFEIAFITAGIFTYNGIYSLIPIFIHSVYTFGTWIKDLRITYTIGIGSAILWIIYGFVIRAYVSIIASVIELVASIIGLRKVLLNNKEEEKC